MTLVRDPVLRGVHHVAGLLFEAGTDSDRVLAAWRAGATLLRLDDDSLVVRFAEPVLLRCEAAPALPLVDLGGALVGLPVEAADVEGAVVRLRHGRLVGHAVVATVDPSSLLDLSGWRVHRVAVVPDPPHPPAPRPPRLAPAATPIDFDSRARLGAQLEPGPKDRGRWRRLQPSPGGTPTGGLGLLDVVHRYRHRRYLDELTRLFAKGEVEEALRRALPLGGADSERKATRVPGRRKQLRINLQRRLGSGLDVEPGLRAELLQRYRAGFLRLEREGRILDAAFVLADLMNRTDEACQFLERHGETRLAAELSEARSDDHGETVRLWWRAGERDRAVAAARRHGAFAAAVLRLEQGMHDDEARALRQEWMGHLLQAGDLVSAYDVAVDLDGEEVAAMRRRLIDIAIEQGGPVRARMLARQLRAGHDAPHPAVEAVIADPDARRDRVVLAQELAAREWAVDHPNPVRALARRLLAEPAGLNHRVIATVVGLAKDPALRADLPVLSELPVDVDSAAALPEPLWLDIDRFDRGQVGVWDARMLDDGRLVAATDGAGVRVVRPNGRVAMTFDVTAHRLVPSDAGTRVLALRTLDGEALGVTVLDLLDRRARSIGEVPATAWADTYDGAQWFLAKGTTMWMLDMLADGPTALWRSGEVDVPILAVERAPDWVRAVHAGGATDYYLPGLVRFTGAPREPGFEVDIEEASDGPIVVVRAARVMAPVATVQLVGAARVVTHLDGDVLVAADDCGRIEIVDLAAGAARLSLRMTV